MISLEDHFSAIGENLNPLFPLSIFTSLEQPSTPTHGVPSGLNTGGSLPDLSSLHFPSPLPTPLDQDEPCYPGSSSLSGGGSTGNLASTLTQLGINAANPQGGNSIFHHHTPGTLGLYYIDRVSEHTFTSLDWCELLPIVKIDY